MKKLTLEEYEAQQRGIEQALQRLNETQWDAYDTTCPFCDVECGESADPPHEEDCPMHDSVYGKPGPMLGAFIHLYMRAESQAAVARELAELEDRNVGAGTLRRTLEEKIYSGHRDAMKHAERVQQLMKRVIDLTKTDEIRQGLTRLAPEQELSLGVAAYKGLMRMLTDTVVKFAADDPFMTLLRDKLEFEHDIVAAARAMVSKIDLDANDSFIFPAPGGNRISNRRDFVTLLKSMKARFAKEK